MFISVDPGKNVGVATFSSDGTDVKRKIYSLDVLPTFLDGVYNVTRHSKTKVVFIYEDFTLRQDKAIAQTGSDMPASQAIGMLKQVDAMLGNLSQIEVVKAGNLRTAFKWAGMPEIAKKMERSRSYHPADDLVAYAHGVMWLINNNYRKHPIFES